MNGVVVMGVRRVDVGDTVKVQLPWSEVCMHMRVADQVRNVLIGADGATILNDDGSAFCAAVTHGEASVYRDASGFYVSDMYGN